VKNIWTIWRCRATFTTLFSNASRDAYVQNTNSDFTVKLAQSVDLDSTSNWEVALSEISRSPPFMEEDTTALMYCNLMSPQFVGDITVRQHADIRLPIIIIIISVSARFSKTVYCARRAAEISGHWNEFRACTSPWRTVRRTQKWCFVFEKTTNVKVYKMRPRHLQ